jgi:hypothetical protein
MANGNGCATGVELFRRGTDIKLPFLVTADNTIVDITDGVVTAIIEPMGMSEILLEVGLGIQIVDESPPVALPGNDQAPHGFILVDAATTATLPLGQLTELTILYTTPENIKTYAPTIWLRGE